MASIIVIGGGVAGLACAWRLRRAGHEVEVLERQAVAGGRMRTETYREFRLDRGAQCIASGYRNLHAVVDTLGLGPRVRPIARPGDAILRDGRLHAVGHGSPWGLLASGLVSARAKARLLRLPLEVLRNLRRLDPLRPAAAAALDTEDLASGLRRVVGDEVFDYLLAPIFSSGFDSEPEDLSYAFGLLALRLLAGGLRLQSFEGGTGLLTETLAGRVPVRSGCEVFSVETESGGARVRYRVQDRERSALADAAVLALPGCAVARVCPKLTPDERGFFEQVRYVRGMIAYLLLERPLSSLPHYGVAFPRREGLGLYGLALDHHKPGAAPPGAGLVNAALTQPAAARMWQASDAAVEGFVLGNLSRTPIGELSPMACVVHRWPAMLPQFGAGYLRRLARFQARMDRSPRLAFAGDYLVGPHAEGALTSGMRAATEIARAL